MYLVATFSNYFTDVKMLVFLVLFYVIEFALHISTESLVVNGYARMVVKISHETNSLLMC